MTFATAPPSWVLVALAVAVTLVAYGGYWRSPLSTTRRAVLVTLRFLALGCVALALLRPLVSVPPRAGQALVPILVDTSLSMAIRGGAAGTRRLDDAIALLRDHVVPRFDAFDAVEGELRLTPEVLTFGAEVSRLASPEGLTSAEPIGDRTDLGDALSSVQTHYAGMAIAGVILVSDGSDSTGTDPREVASTLDVPVFTFAVGEDPNVDLEVATVVTERTTVEASLVEIDVSVVARGYRDGVFDVRLVQDGQPMDVRRVRVLDDEFPARIRFQVGPETAGATLYTIEIPPVAGEVVLENNRQLVLVPPPQRPRRLLMVEGAPGHDHGFLKRTWRADPGIELDAVVRKGQNDLGEPTFYVQADPDRGVALGGGYPRARAELFRYDGVVFANLPGDTLRPDQISMTADFVEVRGGGLLLTGSASLPGRGLRGSPLEKVLPVTLADRGNGSERGSTWRNGMTPEPDQPDRSWLTEDGKFHPVTQLGATPEETAQKWRELPRLAGSVALGPARPGASVLAAVSAPGSGLRSLLAVQRYGRGRTMVFAGEGAWRWQMMLPADDRAYERLWGQAARWLTASANDPVSLTVPHRVPVGQAVDVDIQVYDDHFQPQTGSRPMLSIEGPTGRVTTRQASASAAGGYRAAFTTEAPGVYRLETTVATAQGEPRSATDWVLAGGVSAEFSDPRVRPELLQRVSEASGGRLLSDATVDELPTLLRRAFAERSDGSASETREVWHGAWTFALVLTLLVGEWLLRRAWGLR